MIGRRFAAVAALVALTLAGCASTPKPAGQCHIGIYGLAGGGLVDVAPTDVALRWRLMDGRSGELRPGGDGGWASTLGWTGRPDGTQVSFGDCSDGRIRFAGEDGARLPLLIQDTTFAGAGGVSLAGRLVMPAGSGPVPVVVMVHGSESTSAQRYYAEQRLFPANGVGVFVYDKRGTGASKGKYTQDFEVLSDDAVAAVAQARRLSQGRASRVGVNGGSQGGWIAPLAASKTPVDFVIARYGMAQGPLAEDREEILQDVAPYGPEAMRKAAEVSDATAKVMASNFRTGWRELAEVRRKYGREPWFKAVKGDWSGDILKYPPAVLRVAGPFFGKGTSWDYDPMPVLRQTSAPMLWMLAAEDRSAPVPETRRRLLMLRAEGRPISVLEFPATEHGVQEFIVVDGERKLTRYADGYFQAQIDFAKTGALAAGEYGSAKRLTP